ncbi:hypothetical protein STAQ_37930 [Allostella sp. ATCC 35155]|nr:hypothetical protein STAQ_37930 [Stella sp. ATCC 35155]
MSDLASPSTGWRAGWRRWLVPGFLLVSLALNVFLVSALVGRYARDHGPGPGAPIGFRGLTDGLPQEARETVRDSFRARRTEIRQERQELRAARRAVQEALAADPYDPDAARRAFGALREASGELARLAQDSLVEAAGRLPASQRRELLDQRERPPRPPRDRPDGPPGPPPGGRD